MVLKAARKNRRMPPSLDMAVATNQRMEATSRPTAATSLHTAATNRRTEGMNLRMDATSLRTVATNPPMAAPRIRVMDATTVGTNPPMAAPRIRVMDVGRIALMGSPIPTAAMETGVVVVMTTPTLPAKLTVRKSVRAVTRKAAMGESAVKITVVETVVGTARTRLLGAVMTKMAATVGRGVLSMAARRVKATLLRTTVAVVTRAPVVGMACPADMADVARKEGMAVTVAMVGKRGAATAIAERRTVLREFLSGRMVNAATTGADTTARMMTERMIVNKRMNSRTELCTITITFM